MGQAPRAAGTALRALSAAALVAVLGAAPYASAQVRLVSSAPKAPEAPARPAYVDRVIEGLAPEPVEPDASAQYDPAGWPRFLRLETRLGTRPFENDNRAYGFQVTAGLETPSHGTFSLDAALDPEERRQTFTLRQRGLPMDGGWLVNNELGVSTPLAPAIQRLPSRVFLPSVVTRGGATEWLNARHSGEHRPPSLASEGFVHLSTPEQVHLPANRLFGGRRDLVLLRLDPARLGAPVKWEPGAPSDDPEMRFPHLYGPLPAGAVVAVEEFQPGPDGVFAPLGR